MSFMLDANPLFLERGSHAVEGYGLQDPQHSRRRLFRVSIGEL